MAQVSSIPPPPTPTMPIASTSTKELGIVAEKTNKLWILLFIATAAGGAVLIAYGAGQFSNPPPENLNDTMDIVKMTAGSFFVVGSAIQSYRIATSLKRNIRNQLLKKYDIRNGSVYLKENGLFLCSKKTFDTLVKLFVIWENKNSNLEKNNNFTCFQPLNKKQEDPIGLIIEKKGNVYKLYYYEEELGVGAYGKVYKIIDIANGTFGAIKISTTNSDANKKTKHEHLMLNRAKIPVSELLEIEGRQTFTQELGEDFFIWRDRSKPDIIKKAEIIDQIISNLTNMHKNNIYHRDIKTDNIIVFERNGKHYFEFRDYGSAVDLEKIRGNELIREITNAKITPKFTARSDFNKFVQNKSLEVVINDSANDNEDIFDVFKHDVFGLGVTLCHIIADQFPYPRDTSDFMKTDEAFLEEILLQAFEDQGITEEKTRLIVDLIKEMTDPLPSNRPTMEEVQRRWRAIKKPLNV